MADEDQETTPRGFKDTGVKVTYTIGFVAASVAGIVVTILIFGLNPLALFGGLLLGGALGTLLASLYMRGRRPVAARKVHRPGAVACPACGSLQTDLVVRGGSRRFLCFACDHAWAPPKG